LKQNLRKPNSNNNDKSITEGKEQIKVTFMMLNLKF
jgi:hypothetical protein